jgi:hypothetical protein
MVLTKTIKLEYLKGSAEKMAWAKEKHGIDGRMWNLLAPELPGYKYDGSFPTFTVNGLRELNRKGLI